MKNINEGVLIFNSWFESAKVLSGLEFKKLFLAIYDYQIHGIEPPSFTPKGEGIARNIFPCLDKRIKGAIYAKQGASINDGNENRLYPKWEPIGVKTPTLYTKEEKSKVKQSISSYEEREKWRDFFDTAAAHALGQTGDKNADN